MSKESYIRTLLNESLLNEENIEFCDTASDLDDVAYVLFNNYISSDEFKEIMKSDNGISDIENIKFSYIKQENFIAIKNEKSNPGIEKIYLYSKDYLRKMKLMSLNDIE